LFVRTEMTQCVKPGDQPSPRNTSLRQSVATPPKISLENLLPRIATAQGFPSATGRAETHPGADRLAVRSWFKPVRSRQCLHDLITHLGRAEVCTATGNIPCPTAGCQHFVHRSLDRLRFLLELQ